MNSDIIKSPKIAGKFICEKCNYNCSKRSDFYKHTKTAKHINRINGTKKSQKSPQTHICLCGKEYKYSRGLWEHKKKCSQIINNNNAVVVQENLEDKLSVMDIITQNKELMNLLVIQNQEHKEETKELMKQNQEMQKTIQELVPKIGNNNTTTNNNNQFNLQVFLNEDCKEAINFSDFIKQIQVSFEDIENQAESGYVKGISKLFL